MMFKRRLKVHWTSKARTKPWQRLEDELKALKLQSPKELDSVEIVEEQD